MQRFVEFRLICIRIDSCYHNFPIIKMKFKMKQFSLYFLVILLSILSCRKESLTDIHNIDTEDPKEIEGVLFKGAVTNSNIKIPNAEIEVYQNEKLVGTVMSNENGNFNTLGLKLELDSPVTFSVNKEGFPSQAKRRTEFNKVGEVNFNLYQNLDTLNTIQNNPNPASSDLVTLGGYIYDSDQKPIKDVIVYAFHDSIRSTIFPGWTYTGESTATDADGRFDMIVPNNKPIIFRVVQSICMPTTPPPFSSSNIITSRRLEILDSNTEMGALITPGEQALFIPENVNFRGRALDCEGNIVKNGRLLIQLIYDNQIKEYFSYLRNGELRWGQTICRAASRTLPIKIKVKVIDPLTDKESEWIEFDNTKTNTQNLVIQTCLPSDAINCFLTFEDTSVGFSNFTYELKNDTLDILCTDEGQVSTTIFRLRIPNIRLGQNKFDRFSYAFISHFNSTENKFLRQNDQILEATVNKMSSNICEGTFEGKVMQTHKDISKTVDISGRFRVKI